MIEKFKHFNKLYEKINNFSSLIDYTYLKNNATVDDIKSVCDDAVENKYYSVCVMPDFVGSAKAFLDDEDVKICTVVSFPNGDDSTNSKVKETLKAITDGADEIDMVMDYKLLKELSIETGEEYDDIYKDLVDDVRSVSKVCHSDGLVLKVIIEIEELNYNQIKLACVICVEAGADIIMTSTGMSKTMKSFQEKIDQIKYMRKILPEYTKIKVSGGIRSIDQINEVIPYVDRVATSIVIENK
jgi:deoxyribose-phosphate aldolase